MSLLEFTERGIYCQRAGIFIDPSQGVPKALITHAHSDHARAGCQNYLCTTTTAPLLKQRLGVHQNIQSIPFGENISINGVRFSFHPAGHIVGSAQIRVEYHGEVWVVSGDYKIEADQISEEFELVRCHTFVTESTFGLPVFQWTKQTQVYSEINTWWAANKANGVTSVISAYSLGKAQRIIQNIDHTIGPVFCHGSVEVINEVLRTAGIPLKATSRLPDHADKQVLRNALIIAPGSALSSPWMRRFREYSTAAASGWMILRGRKNWYHVDRGFVLSDHVDWNALNATITATGCEQVIVTHGYSDVFARWLREKGYRAQAEKTDYGDSEETG
jgi:putative mRNA 3-end processing factor